MDGGARADHQRVAGEQVVKADGLKAERGREIDIGIEIGMGGVAPVHGGADPRMCAARMSGRRAKQIGRQMLAAAAAHFPPPRRDGRCTR